MATASDMAKNIAVATAHQPSPTSDANIELITQGLMIEDTDLKRILKGEIQKFLDQLASHDVIIEQMSRQFIEVTNLSFQYKQITATQANELLVAARDLTQAIQDQKSILEKIYGKLVEYREMVPYLMILSPLTRLSNLTQQMADALKRKLSIMINRDRIVARRRGNTIFTNPNFHDGLEIAGHICFQDAVGGWKMQGVVTEKRQVLTTFEDRSRPARKHWWQP